MNNTDLMHEDLNVLWHPCTQMKDHEIFPLIPIKSAHGVYLEDFDGNSYIDAISSWWVNIFGHTNKYINDQIKKQLDSLEHVLLAGFTHEPVIKLSKRLVDITPVGLNKCFYADNGSSAVEVALKMSYHAHKNNNKERPLFVSLKNSYHGETIGALSVGDVELYKDTYKSIMIKSVQTAVPQDQSIKEAIRAAGKFEELCSQKASVISAIIIEPLIQGAGCMHMYHPEFILRISRTCKEYGIYLIADEVMTGFGRSGTMFACEQAKVTPDFMVLSKGLTGGYLPLSVVLTTDDIYNLFYCSYAQHKAFLHSHSYTGNALACAAANATLDIFEKDNIIEKNKDLSAYMKIKLQKFHKLGRVKNIRQTGMVCAFDLNGFDASERIGMKIYQFGLANGVLLRPLGATIYFMPPYIITYAELDKMFDVAYDAVLSLDD